MIVVVVAVAVIIIIIIVIVIVVVIISILIVTVIINCPLEAALSLISVLIPLVTLCEIHYVKT